MWNFDDFLKFGPNFQWGLFLKCDFGRLARFFCEIFDNFCEILCFRVTFFWILVTFFLKFCDFHVFFRSIWRSVLVAVLEVNRLKLVFFRCNPVKVDVFLIILCIFGLKQDYRHFRQLDFRIFFKVGQRGRLSQDFR